MTATSATILGDRRTSTLAMAPGGATVLIACMIVSVTGRLFPLPSITCILGSGRCGSSELEMIDIASIAAEQFGCAVLTFLHTHLLPMVPKRLVHNGHLSLSEPCGTVRIDPLDSVEAHT